MSLQIIKMISPKLQIKLLSLLVTSLIVGLLTVACDCEKRPDGIDTNKAEAGKVILKVTPPNLVGDQQRDMTVMLKLEGNTGTFNLEKLKLKVLLTTKGTAKTTLYYKNGNKETQVDPAVELPLSHFTTTKELTEAEPSLPLLFKIAVPDEDDTQVSIQFILLGENNDQLSEDGTTWHSSPNNPVNLKLQRREGDRVLKGAERECRLEITNLGTEKIENINDNQLQLKIAIEGGPVKIKGAKEQQDGSYILDFSVHQPERFKGSNSIFQTIEMQQIAGNKVRLIVELLYEGASQNKPVEIIWEQGEIEVKIPHASKRFFANQVFSFYIFNHSSEDVPTDDITLELISDNQASFQFVKSRHTLVQKMGLASVAFSQLENEKNIFASGSNQDFGFVLDDDKKETKARIKVQVKRKGQVVATSEDLIWEAQGIGLQILLVEKGQSPRLLSQNSLVNNNIFNLQLTNQGNIPVNTDEIQVSISDTEGVSFKLGHVAGINITKTLSEVLGKSMSIQPSNTVNMDLQVVQDAKSINHDQAVLKLTFQDKENNVLVEEKVTWENRSIFEILHEKASEKAPLFESFRKKSSPLYIGIDKFNLRYSKSNIDLSSYTQDLSNLSDALVALYKLRKEAEDALTELPNVKKVYEEALSQNKNNYSDGFKEELQQNIEHIAGLIENKYSITDIEVAITKAFNLITRKAQEFLEKAKKSHQANDEEVTQQYIAAIKQSATVASKFVTEIGTDEAKKLAAEMKRCKQQAEEL